MSNPANLADTVFGGFAPNSETVQVMSKFLGSRPVRYASRQALMEAIHEAFPHLRPRKSEPSAQPVEKPAKIRTERNETENV